MLVGFSALLLKTFEKKQEFGWVLPLQILEYANNFGIKKACYEELGLRVEPALDRDTWNRPRAKGPRFFFLK